MQVQNGLLSLLLLGIIDEAGNFFATSVRHFHIYPANGAPVDGALCGSKQVFFGGYLGGLDDIFPRLLIDVHNSYKLEFNFR